MSAPAKLQVNWEAHLEALPLATWIVRFDAAPSQSQNQDVVGQCGPVFANHACRRLLGLTTKSEQLGEPWLASLHPQERQAYLKAWQDFIAGRTTTFVQKVRWVRPDNQEVISLAVRAQKLQCGDIQGWLRTATLEDALSRLEELAYVRP